MKLSDHATNLRERAFGSDLKLSPTLKMMVGNSLDGPLRLLKESADVVEDMAKKIELLEAEVEKLKR